MQHHRIWPLTITFSYWIWQYVWDPQLSQSRRHKQVNEIVRDSRLYKKWNISKNLYLMQLPWSRKWNSFSMQMYILYRWKKFTVQNLFQNYPWIQNMNHENILIQLLSSAVVILATAKFIHACFKKKNAWQHICEVASHWLVAVSSHAFSIKLQTLVLLYWWEQKIHISKCSLS